MSLAASRLLSSSATTRKPNAGEKEIGTSQAQGQTAEGRLILVGKPAEQIALEDIAHHQTDRNGEQHKTKGCT